MIKAHFKWNTYLIIYSTNNMIMNTLQFDMKKLGVLLTKWDKKNGTAAEYKQSNSNYRTYKPSVSTTPQGGLFIATTIDHIRGFAKDDHAQLEMEFNASGAIISSRAKFDIADNPRFDTGLVKSAAAVAGGVASGPEAGAASGAIAEVAAKIANSLSGAISKMGEHGGRANFPAIVRMNMNKIFESLIIPKEPSVTGAIRVKWLALGGPSSFLGQPLTDELTTPDGVGHFNHFRGGSIYWTPKLGAHEVHGSIREKWEALGWERSFLGYPTTDELTTPDKKGRYNHFQNGSIYWTPELGAHEVHGSIRDKWSSLGWERSFLGYPTTDEQDKPGGGRISHFEHGSISWTRSEGAVVHRN